MRLALLSSTFFLLACSGSGTPKPGPSAPSWAPGTIFSTAREATSRGFIDRRGLIHAHSPYSHDACDGKPRLADGGIDLSCLDDFRSGICHSGHDFVFLSDHGDSFSRTEFPDTLLYQPEKGDQLVLKGDKPIANRFACPGGSSVLIMAGIESDMMPVGLEEHIAPTEAERSAVYGVVNAQNVERLEAAGGVVIIQHTEQWNADQLTSLPIDGFEMFNLHFNALANAGNGLELVLKLEKGQFDGLPDPNMLLAAFRDVEASSYLDTWGAVLARGAKRTTTMGTDCHRNTLPQLAQDGERLDSYRRMMEMFSNHLLVRPRADGSIDPASLKEALKASRLYGVFEFLGYAKGFDYVAEEGGQVREMGETVSLAKGVTLKVSMPTVERMSTGSEAPGLRARVLHAVAGGWEEVASSTSGSISYTVTQPGAYRSEVRIVPRHVKQWLGTYQDLGALQRPWVYSNAIYVAP